jgi:hypothetical protein
LLQQASGKRQKVGLRKLREVAARSSNMQDANVAANLWEVGKTFSQAVLRHFVGHPHVVDDTGDPLVVEDALPILWVDKDENDLRLVLEPREFDEDGYACTQVKGRLRLFRRTQAVVTAQELTRQSAIRLPSEALPRLAELFAVDASGLELRWSNALVYTLPDAELARDVPLCVQLFRTTSGFSARFRSRPLRPSGPAFRVAQGARELVVAGPSGPARSVRDFAREEAARDALLGACPTLACLPREGEDCVARTADDALATLQELSALGDRVRCEWPEGEPLQVPVLLDKHALQWRVLGESGGYLHVSGSVRVDENEVLSMRELLDARSKASGPFVTLPSGALVRLTDDLAKRIDALSRVEELGGTADKKGGRRIPLALLPALEGILGEDDGLSPDGEGSASAGLLQVRQRLGTLRADLQKNVKVPRALKAELRDYQLEGFRFLERRAGAGLGACLADDMGLGKTVQALALLVHRARVGPQLVIAPTSIARNWQLEAARFAPTLRVELMATADRDALLRQAGAGVVVVCSYGLLVSAQERLAECEWATVVFDEAHALKNADTQRWRAAETLNTDAAIALTGTPVENHAAEMHALFEQLVPGMLGDKDAFERAFGRPIANGNKDAALQLRAFVRPFVLRRTKSEVLTELPAKTEITRMVKLTPKELAFYEAV